MDSRLNYQYILFVDEAGDDKVDRLKPEHPNGNSEWLCIGGYLVRAEVESDLDRRRDAILYTIGGSPGGQLHYRNLSAENRLIAVTLLARKDNPARGFVVCSYKRTMLGYQNERAAAASIHTRDTLYNFVGRLLLERVTHFVSEDALSQGNRSATLRVIFSMRKGHHFGRFKAYLKQLVHQAIAGTTFLNTREIVPNVLRWEYIQSAPTSQHSGLQLADTLVSAIFQSIEQASPNYSDKPGRALLPLMAENRHNTRNTMRSRANEGVTLFPPKASHHLSRQQAAFFMYFGYDPGLFDTRSR